MFPEHAPPWEAKVELSQYWGFTANSHLNIYLLSNYMSQANDKQSFFFFVSLQTRGVDIPQGISTRQRVGMCVHRHMHTV